jgi:CheY-like chemotaxis protein
MTLNSKGKRIQGPHATRWTNVAEQPERWELSGYGAIIAREPGLWSLLPTCGHGYYAALSFERATALAEERAGLCYACWRRELAREGRTASGFMPVVRPTPPGGTSLRPAHAPTVLVVDDDADIRETIAELLEDEGYSAVSAANGVEALRLLRAGFVPSLILLDLMMPLMDGYSCRAELRCDPVLSSITVVVITAGATIRHHELDVAAICRKPLDLTSLLAIVGQCCGVELSR